MSMIRDAQLKSHFYARENVETAAERRSDARTENAASLKAAHDHQKEAIEEDIQGEGESSLAQQIGAGILGIASIIGAIFTFGATLLNPIAIAAVALAAGISATIGKGLGYVAGELATIDNNNAKAEHEAMAGMANVEVAKAEQRYNDQSGAVADARQREQGVYRFGAQIRQADRETRAEQNS